MALDYNKVAGMVIQYNFANGILSEANQVVNATSFTEGANALSGIAGTLVGMGSVKYQGAILQNDALVAKGEASVTPSFLGTLAGETLEMGLQAGFMGLGGVGLWAEPQVSWLECRSLMPWRLQHWTASAILPTSLKPSIRI